VSTTDREFFEHLYRATPDPWSFASSDYERRRFARILAFVPQRCFRRVFEPGCSSGELTAALARRCGHVTAIDIAETAVAAARERCRRFDNVDVRLGSVLDEPPRGPFDLVVFSELGYYLSDRDLIDVGSMLASRIEPSGQLLASHWTGRSSDHVLDGARVHAILKENLPLEHFHHEARPWTERDGFVLDIWRKPPEVEELETQTSVSCAHGVDGNTPPARTPPAGAA